MRAPALGSRLAAPMLAWLAGVAVQLQERSLQAFPFYAACVVAGVVAVVAGLAWRRRPLAAALLAGAGALLAGFGLAGAQASLRLDEALAPGLKGRDLVVTGVVASLPQAGPNGLRFRFALARRGGGLSGRAAAPADARRDGGVAVQALDAFLELLAAIPGAVRTVPAAPRWAQVAGLAAAGLAIFRCPGGPACWPCRSRSAC